MSDNRITNVVVLGGGTAGWMSAAYLAKAFGPAAKVTVLEAPQIPKIGVGEATIPNLQRTLFDYLGIAESEWMRECNASYKMAVKFVNWRTPGAGQAQPRDLDGRADRFYHTFGQLPNHAGLPLSHYWVHDRLNGLTDEQFDDSCYVEPAVMDRKLSPITHDGSGWTSHAWHFDAHLVAEYLRKFATTKQGVEHVQGMMTDAVVDSRGYVTHLRTDTGATIAGDLFVDCSGFRGLLINKVMREPFLDMSDHLLNDSAVATQVPNDDDETGVEPYTSAIAMSSGWSWKIPLLGRFGTGYVFSSRHQSRDEATLEFCRMWGLDPEKQTLNQISFRSGRNRRTWVRNVVSIGLSSCFLEPLESTGIYFITAALYQFARHLPDKGFDPVLINRFNAEIETMFDDSRDFLQAHFSFAPRNDSQYWRDCKELELTDNILEKIAMYRSGLPVNMPIVQRSDEYYDNFEAEFRNFWTNSNYYCIFAGLGMLPDRVLPALATHPEELPGARLLLRDVKREQERRLETLPSMHEHLLRFHGKG